MKDQNAKGARTWVDRGGTFTDVVSWTPGSPPTARKVPSDQAVVGAMSRGQLVFGTTVATNALLERTGVPTALLVTRGFADLVTLRHLARPRLFDPDADWPQTLATRVIEIDGRLDTQGDEVEPLAIPSSLDLTGMEAVAIVLMNSHRNGDHESRLARAVRAEYPTLHISVGHRLSPELGYLARVETTLVDAAMTPILHRAMADDQIPSGALAIRSDGGLVAADSLRAPDAVLSGPAGGVLAVARIAAREGTGAVGLDMGGTSTDICCVTQGQLPRRQGDVPVAGVMLRRPMLEVETIAAGGGSVLWDDGIQLRVGPASAGADPGPQCYGRGGPPTLTDAALILGLVDDRAFTPPLDRSAVALPGDAQAYLDVGREHMAAAVRRIACARGLEIRDWPLVAYGGAAGAHAAAVADLLDMRTVLVHPFSAVLSAWGQTMATQSHESVTPIWRTLSDAWPLLVAAAATPNADGTSVHRLVELRPPGTDHAIAVPITAQDSIETIRIAYHAAHREQFGFQREAAELEVVNLRERVVTSAPVDIHEALPDPWGIPAQGVSGPCRLDCPTTSVWVPDGWHAHPDDGVLRLTRRTPRHLTTTTQRTRHGISVWGSRFMAIAAEAGSTVQRLARSVNIRERLDYSCAIFDASGQLVANAPHIPVHLGAMGETVRDLLSANLDLTEGSAWLTNDPCAGGSHLPDLTVVTPVYSGTCRWFVACRGHHVDVGGLTPGSMPPHSTRLSDEGIRFRRVPLLEDGELRDLSRLLEGCRHPDVVQADLAAQIAANARAARALVALGEADVVSAWMAHLQDAAAEAVQRAVQDWPAGTACDEIDGVPLQVRVSKQDDKLLVDFRGTGGPHAGNLNAPLAVVRAAVLYVLRIVVADDIPLNEGALRAVKLKVPHPSILSPHEDSAVAGGNVETSQRLADLLCRAMGLRAASQGTMNNLTLGGDGWSIYETIGGGQGASSSRPGRSASQVHMTNTRMTDPEVLEARVPIRVRELSIRLGSGGAGRHAGGDGVVRDLEVLEPCTAALLATRRRSGAPGMSGGKPGAPGRDQVRRGEHWLPWDGEARPLGPGDRIRIETPGGGGWGAPPDNSER